MKVQQKMTKSVFTGSYQLLIDFLRTARTKVGLSQAELASRIGRPQQFISFVELGERRVDILEFYAIMRAVGQDPSDAFRTFAEGLPEQIDI